MLFNYLIKMVVFYLVNEKRSNVSARGVALWVLSNIITVIH
jgi:hypothetical protein